MLIDTHCHLDFPAYDPDREEVIRRAKDAGINYIVNIASSLKGSQDSLELAGKYDCIYASSGIHPHEADNVPAEAIAEIKKIAQNPKVTAIGEIGLDYYRNFSEVGNQRKLFVSQLGIAKELQLPVILHVRQAPLEAGSLTGQAEDDMLVILKDFLPLQAVVHCFSGGEKFLQQCLSLGFFVSFTCNITYKKAQNLREIVKITPLDRLMLETDGPYLAPEGQRGKRNEPLNIKLLAEEIARIKAVSFEEIALATTKNAKDFFRI